jgi:hypothetical protein
MFSFRIRFALATLLLCTSVIPVFAQTASDTQTVLSSKLSLHDAIAATLALNPQLTSFQFSRQALEGELQTAGLKPALHLSTNLENAAGP